MHATECCFFSADDFSVAALVDFAAAVSADIQAGLQRYGYQTRESFEQACAEFLSFGGEFEDFLIFFTNRLHHVFDQSFFFKLLEKRIDQTWADFFSDSFLEAVQYAVAVGRSLVQNG